MAVIALEEKKHYAGGNKLDFENHLRFAAQQSESAEKV